MYANAIPTRMAGESPDSYKPLDLLLNEKFVHRMKGCEQGRLELRLKHSLAVNVEYVLNWQFFEKL